ncbi:MAG: YceI family protein [Candidatus Melainabacteria bacterium]
MSFPRQATALLLAFILAGSTLYASAAQKTFTIGDPNNRDHVEFTSDAPVELIKGSTPEIKGKVSFDDQFRFDAKHPFTIAFDVDLASIRTGIPLRDQHMRDNFLETDKYPNATYKVTKVVMPKKPSLKRVETVTLTATGDFTLHGVTVKKTVPLKVTYFPESADTKKRFPSGNLIRIQGTFPVNLTAHHIQRPEAVFVKLAETVFVSVDAFGTDGALK